MPPKRLVAPAGAKLRSRKSDSVGVGPGQQAGESTRPQRPFTARGTELADPIQFYDEAKESDQRRKTHGRSCEMQAQRSKRVARDRLRYARTHALRRTAFTTLLSASSNKVLLAAEGDGANVDVAILETHISAEDLKDTVKWRGRLHSYR